MKKTILLFAILLVFIFPKSTLAHFANQQPFFKINSQYANLYPVPLTSLENFNLPQDLSPSNYLVNQTLNFEIDISRFPVLPEVASKTKYNWDFGDGQQTHGLTASHTYTKIGSYILAIYADDGVTVKPQIFESILVNILPSKDYQLPKAVIKINSKQVNDPLTDISRFDFENQIKFDATASVANSGKIVEYFWDFGDQQSSSSAITSHSYDKSRGQGQFFPVLRVKDANGFIADTFAEIENPNNLTRNPSFNYPAPAALPVGIGNKGAKKPSQLKYSVGGLILLLVIAYTIRWLILRRKAKKLF